MSKFKENMNAVFDLPESEYEIIEDGNFPAVKNPTEITTVKAVEDANEDYNFIRQNLLDTIKRSKLALDEIGSIASVTEQPRAFEVYAKLVDTINVANRDLIQLHHRMKDYKDKNKSHAEPSSTVTNNSIFVGTTAELAKMLNDE